MKELFNLSGKVAVISGGAGSIGGAIATGFAEHGAKLALIDLNEEALKKQAAEIAKKTGTEEAFTMKVNITDEEDVARVVKGIVDELGTVDILVNAHGVNKKSKGLDFDMKDWKFLHDVNSMGTMISCKQFGKVMTQKGSGKVINLSSVRGLRANAGGNSAYCSTKGSVDMITRCLAAEWAEFKVNVNAIGPALIATPLTEQQMKEPGRTERYLRNIPMGRLATIEDMAGAAIFLASAASDFVTGHILYVDGGLMAIG